MKIVIFTRTGFHHTYFISRLQERFDVVLVVRESYPQERRENLFLDNLFRENPLKRIKDGLFLKKFHRMYSAGFRYHKALGEYLKSPFDVMEEKPGTKYLNVPCGHINSGEFASFLADMKPDVIAVLGSSVIKPHIISIPSTAMINLHSGLSPYYRGTWSYGWPIVNREPEYIGATVHRVDEGIDSGDILSQTKPCLVGADDLNTIFLKVIAEGTELVADAIKEIGKTGSVKTYEQPKNTGRLYRAIDFNADAARECLENLSGGTIREYVADKEAKDSKLQLFGYVPPKVYR